MGSCMRRVRLVSCHPHITNGKASGIQVIKEQFPYIITRFKGIRARWSRLQSTHVGPYETEYIHDIVL
jgi:hypothetical protein